MPDNPEREMPIRELNLIHDDIQNLRKQYESLDARLDSALKTITSDLQARVGKLEQYKESHEGQARQQLEQLTRDAGVVNSNFAKTDKVLFDEPGGVAPRLRKVEHLQGQHDLIVKVMGAILMLLLGGYFQHVFFGKG